MNPQPDSDLSSQVVRPVQAGLTNQKLQIGLLISSVISLLLLFLVWSTSSESTSEVSDTSEDPFIPMDASGNNTALDPVPLETYLFKFIESYQGDAIMPESLVFVANLTDIGELFYAPHTYPGMFESVVPFYFLKKPTGEIHFLKKHSITNPDTSVTVDYLLGKGVVEDATTFIPELDAPEKITLPGDFTLSTNYSSDFGGKIELVSVAAPTSSQLIHKIPQGTVYRHYDFYNSSPQVARDLYYLETELGLRFTYKRADYNEYDTIPKNSLTWPDGSSNVHAYTLPQGRKQGIGGGSLLLIYLESLGNESRLQTVGQLADGRAVYTIQDETHALITNAVEALNNYEYFDIITGGYVSGTNSFTPASLVKEIPFIFVADGAGQKIIFVRDDYAPVFALDVF